MRPSKRDELVHKALQTFYRNGFHATGMDTLVAETGISKTSMYKHFRSKEDLILAVLRLRDEVFRNRVYRRIEELADTPRDQLIAMFDELQEWFDDPDFRGCMFIKASSEYQDRDHPIHKQSAEHKRMLETHFTNLAKAAGLAQPEQLARQLLLLAEGAIVTAHLKHTERPAQDAKQAALTLVSAHEHKL
jgi:AcrR family transcriptional regulator